MTIRIVTDSTCDLPAAVVEANGITVVPLFINVGAQGYLDGVEMSREEFYGRLPTFDPPPTTATPSPGMFRQAYERLADEGATNVLSIHITVGLSSTVDVARLAARGLNAVRVTVLDSRQLSMGTGFLVEAAAKAAALGHDLGQILAMLEEQIRRTHVFAALDTLKFLQRSGRMSWTVAGLGTLLQIKPLLKMYDGQSSAERVRTRDRAIRRVIELLQACAPLERVALLHTNALESAEALRQRVADILPTADIPAMNINPVIGAHIGPGAVGFACITART